jgi:hypothetical protein
VENADGPAKGAEQNQPVAQYGVAVTPVERQRVEQYSQSGNANADPGSAPRGDALAQEQPRAGHDPQRRGVAQNHRAPRRDELQADGHQGGEGHHVEQRDIDDDGPVAGLGHDQGASRQQQAEQRNAGDGGADRCSPERRHLRDDCLGYRPSDAPGEHHHHEQRDRRVPGQGVAHWLVVAGLVCTIGDVVSQRRSARNLWRGPRQYGGNASETGRTPAPPKPSEVRPLRRDGIADATAQCLALQVLFEANINDGATGKPLHDLLALRLQVFALGDARR